VSAAPAASFKPTIQTSELRFVLDERIGDLS
jgi:hypothetical protein